MCLLVSVLWLTMGTARGVSHTTTGTLWRVSRHCWAVYLLGLVFLNKTFGLFWSSFDWRFWWKWDSQKKTHNEESNGSSVFVRNSSVLIIPVWARSVRSDLFSFYLFCCCFYMQLKKQPWPGFLFHSDYWPSVLFSHTSLTHSVMCLTTDLLSCSRPSPAPPPPHTHTL